MAALEQKKSYFVEKDFKGINVTNNRTAISKGEFSWLENIQPIGFGNLTTISKETEINSVNFSQTVTYISSANIDNVEYIFAFLEDGSAYQINLATEVQSQIASTSTFSSSDVQIVQWKNDRILIIDPLRGYKTWDGTNLVSIGSIGTVTISNAGSGYTDPTLIIGAPNEVGGEQATGEVVLLSGSVSAIILTNAGTGYLSPPVMSISDPTGTSAALTCTLFSQSGTSIATFSGRSWIAQGRTVYYSAVDSYNDFYSVSSGFIVLTDSTLRTDITNVIAANNFLYVFGEDSINVFSDLRINSVTGETLFTNTNVSASIGSPYKYAIFPYFRSMLFMNKYGVYALVGATTSKISDSIDTIFTKIDFTQTITSGHVLINNILCAAWNVTYVENGVSRKIQMVFFDRKWFVTSQGAISLITDATQSGNIFLYGVVGSKFYKLYSDNINGTDWSLSTALWPMDDPIRDKQALKVGLEATLNTSSVNIDLYIDSENSQSSVIKFYNFSQWINNVGTIIPWENASAEIIDWATLGVGASGYYLYRSDAKMYGKYLGISANGFSRPFNINGFQLEHELRARF